MLCNVVAIIYGPVVIVKYLVKWTGIVTDWGLTFGCTKVIQSCTW